MPRRVFIVGGHGYIGRQLQKRLAGYEIVAPSRQECDLFDPDSIQLKGVDTAFYLVHSMGEGRGFEERDRLAALNFGRAATDAGVKRVIYLSGLGEDRESLSTHLRSRHEVGAILRSFPLQVFEFRAGIVIGKGSFSFEMMLALVSRLPVMIMPKWVEKKTQPISIENLLDYLIQAINADIEGNHIFEIGGPDVLSFKELLQEVAVAKGKKRLLLHVPVLTLRLSALWLALVTPVHYQVGRALIESLRHDTIVKHPAPFSIDLIPVKEAIRREI